MDLAKLDAWNATLDAALASEEEADLEPLWDALTEAIVAEPEVPALRRLRARLAEAAGMHATRHEDLAVLRRLDPSDRQAWLDLALLQHRWAFLLVPEEEDDPEDGDGEADEGGAAEDEPAFTLTVRSAQAEADSPQARLEQEALAWLAQMLREHVGDAAFCAQVFARWEQASLHAPWLRLTLALEACAAHPADDELGRVLALAWAVLADQAPEGLDLETSPPPMGFLFDVAGTLWDPFLQERALAALAGLLERRPGEADLLACRARLLQGRCDFAAAAEAFAQAAAAAGRLAVTGQSAEAREQAEELQAQLREQGECCAGGRGAVAAAMLDGMADAMSRFQQPFPLPDGASDARRAFAADWDESMRPRADEMQASLDAMRAAQSAARPDAAQRDQMQAVARQVAASVVGSIAFDPVRMDPVAPAAFEQDWAAVLREMREALAALQWHDLGWVEWPAYRALFGSQVVSSVWCDPSRTLLVLASCAGAKPLVDLESELENGPILITSMSRGRNFLTGGPEVDTLFIEPALALPEAVALHAARLKLAMAAHPGTRPVAIPDLAAVAAAQERARARKTRFRLAQGLTESESLGVPGDFPEVLAPLLRATVRQGLDALNAGR